MRINQTGETPVPLLNKQASRVRRDAVLRKSCSTTGAEAMDRIAVAVSGNGAMPAVSSLPDDRRRDTLVDRDGQLHHASRQHPDHHICGLAVDGVKRRLRQALEAEDGDIDR